MTDPKRVLLRPQAAFAAEESPSLTAPLLVVVAYGAVALATLAPVLVEIAEFLPETIPIEFAVGSEQVSAPGTLVAIMALGIPLLLVVWAVVSGVTYAGARLLGGEGEFVETAAFVAWGFLPKILGGLALGLLAVVVALADPNLTFTELIVGPRSEMEVAGLRIDGPGGSLLPIVFVIEVAATLWTTYVWYGGISGRHALSRRRALALTVVLFLFFNGI